MTTALELLAPAGTADIGIAAIDHGADAVYVGAPMFSARANAGIPLVDIARLVRHAHLFYARVYVALNTILSDAEMPRAEQLLWECADIGVDGMIIQDVGLLERHLPPVPLIASTQMHNDTPEKVKFLEEAGFQRVILARELSLEDIRAIRGKTTVPLETFVHGALCVAYSGQCYLSQILTGRSGNRGVCAQPCRNRFSLLDGDGRAIIRDKYLLSLKDLNRIDLIASLADAGVSSFKIEGRYKGIDYVKNVTAAYRKAIDQVIAAYDRYTTASSGTAVPDFTPDLSRTFNRGYTRYFTTDAPADMASIDTRKSIGAYVGTVCAVGNRQVTVSGKPLHNGDGLCFFTASGTLAGFRVERADGNRIFPNRLQGLTVGTDLYRNRDHAFSKHLQRSSATRKIAVYLHVTIADGRLCLSAKDADGNQADISVALSGDTARDSEQMKQQMVQQFSATGTTAYAVRHLVLPPPPLPFLPAGVLKQMRRSLLEHLTEARQRHYPRRAVGVSDHTTPFPADCVDYRANVFNRDAERFYERHGARVTEWALEATGAAGDKVLMTTRYCLRRQLGACLRDPATAHNLKGPLFLSNGQHRQRLRFDCRKCRMEVVLESPMPLKTG